VAADSPVWLLLLQLADQVSTVTVANASRTDIGASVSLEPAAQHAEDPDSTPPPRTVIAVAGPIEHQMQSTQRRRRVFDVAVECVIWAVDQDAMQQAHAALEDLVDLFGVAARTYRQSSTSTATVQMSRAEVLTRPEGLAAVAAQLFLRVSLSEQMPPPAVLPEVPPP
jgi:hypothetical protein